MYIYLSKIVPILVMPLFASIVLVVFALVVRHRKPRLFIATMLLALAVIWLASMPIMAEYLTQHIESRFPAMPMDEVPNGDCIILLGGSIGAPLAPRVDINLTESIDRVYLTKKLVSAGKASAVIVTGGNQPWSQAQVTEAVLVSELLVEWGVPAEAIYLDGESRNTRENALNSVEIIQKIECNLPLLVTSAAHMPRAYAAFKKVGVETIPVSTDVLAVYKISYSPMDFVPNASALAMTSAVIREKIGQYYYRWRDWN